MIICGIDASTRQTGWCVFDNKKLIDYGKIAPDNSDYTWRERVIFMMNQVAKVIKKYNVDTICVEVPVKTIHNVETLELLFTLHGAIMGIASTLHINFIPVEVNQWRKQLGMLQDIPKKEKNHRAILKERSVKLANELYDLNLIWKSPSSKFNDDDISDAILIAHTVINK